MTNKEKKRILQSYAKIEGRLLELESELEFLEKNPMRPINLTGTRGSGNNKSTIEAATERKEKLEKLIQEEYNDLQILKTRIVAAIKSLDDITERRIIFLKYIGKGSGKYHKTLPLWKIARELGYSVDRVNHLHGTALRNLKL